MVLESPGSTFPGNAIRRLGLMVLALCLGPGDISDAFAQRFRLPRPVEFSTEVQVDEAGHVSRSQLETIPRFLEAGQWDEAVETLRRLMDEEGDKLIRLPGSDAGDGFARYVPLREYCQMRLTGLRGPAAEALALYRGRVDPLAERWYRQGVADQDEPALRRVAERLLVSSYGDDALFHLGELELARGWFTRARAAWERISPALRTPAADGEPRPGSSSGRPLWLALRGVDLVEEWERLGPRLSSPARAGDGLFCPDTDLDLAAVRARLVLVSILEGALERAQLELELLRRLHPQAEGTLAGRQGRYVELLGKLLDESRSWPPVPQPADWPTFAGDYGRGRVLPAPVDIALAPVWSIELPRRAALGTKNVAVSRPGEDAQGLLSYFPLVVERKVLVNTGERIDDVQAYDLHTGQPLWPVVEPVAAAPPVVRPPGLNLPPLPREPWGVPRFTMTAQSGRLYLKLGSQATSVAWSDRLDPPAPGYLAALDLAAEKRQLLEIRLEPNRWGTGWAFEGAPVVDGERLYVVLRRRENLRSQCHLACFALRRNRAELRWRQFLVSAETPALGFLASPEIAAQGELDEITHGLVTLAEGTLYVNSNRGVVAAVDAAEGTIKWLAAYPRVPLLAGDQERPGRYLLRDLNPCLVHRDLVLAAPADGDGVLALDAATGLRIWQTPPGQVDDVVHLLGVADGVLLAGGDRLYWIDAASGRILGRFPERVEGELRGYGRGLVAGGQVYWPTRERIYVLDAGQPRTVRQPIELASSGLTGGHLVYSDGVLLVAGADRLAAYNPWGRPIAKAD